MKKKDIKVGMKILIPKNKRWSGSKDRMGPFLRELERNNYKLPYLIVEDNYPNDETDDISLEMSPSGHLSNCIFSAKDLEPYKELKSTQIGDVINGTHWLVGDSVLPPEEKYNIPQPSQFGNRYFVTRGEERRFGANIWLSPDPIHFTGEIGPFYHTYLTDDFAEPPEPVESAINPSHYQSNGVQVMDQMIAVFGVEKVKSFCEVNAFKYRMRAGKKTGNPIEQDIQKALWYEDQLKKLNV